MLQHLKSVASIGTSLRHDLSDEYMMGASPMLPALATADGSFARSVDHASSPFNASIGTEELASPLGVGNGRMFSPGFRGRLIRCPRCGRADFLTTRDMSNHAISCGGSGGGDLPSGAAPLVSPLRRHVMLSRNPLPYDRLGMLTNGSGVPSGSARSPSDSRRLDGSERLDETAYPISRSSGPMEVMEEAARRKQQERSRRQSSLH